MAADARLDAALSRLGRYHPRRIDLSLDRINLLLRRLGRPERRLPPVVHVAGTNGKGSTIAILRAMLNAHGLTTHTYTSPHLVRFNERFLVADRQIEDEPLLEALAACEEACAELQATVFELTTAAAFLLFSEKSADYALIETGLGGRLDATNVVTQPALTIITPVSIDHQAYLGDTIEKIAAEKAGIIKSKVPCVLSQQRNVVREVIQKKARGMDAPLIDEGVCWWSRPVAEGMVYRDAMHHFSLPAPNLVGKHQIVNAGTAVASLVSLLGSRANAECIAMGLGRIAWPGRLQRLPEGLPGTNGSEHWELWLDGAHNEGGAEALVDYMREWGDKPTYTIMGMLRSKQAAEVIRLIGQHTTELITVPVPGGHACFSPEELRDMAAAVGTIARPMPDVTEAISHLSEDRQPGRIIICGSLYLIGAILEKHEAATRARPVRRISSQAKG
jgi:dihydrofolate synthase/folylpolyglutamate synthase